MKLFRILMVLGLLGLLGAIFVAQGADGQDDVAVTRVRIYGINPQMGLVELTTVPLTSQSGQLELTVGPQVGDAVLVVAAVTPTHGVITSTCWVHMG